MEVRDMIPSQSQIAIQKNVETSQKKAVPGEKFKDLMNRKYSDLNRKKDSESKIQEPKVQEYQSRREMKSSEQASEKNIAKESQKSSISSERSDAEAVADTVRESDALPKESQKDSSETVTTADGAEMLFISPEMVSNEISLPEHAGSSEEGGQIVEAYSALSGGTPEVTVQERRVSESADVAKSFEEKAIAGRMLETNRANLKQLYPMRDPGAETEYTKMLDVLASDPENMSVEVSEISELSMLNEPMIRTERDAPGTESEVPKTEEAPDRIKSELMKRELKDELPSKDALVQKSQKKSETNPTNTFFTEAFSGKTEAVRHHDNMMSGAPRAVMSQVVEAVKVDVKILSDGQALEVKLNPEHLGKVVMKIELKDGRMAANIKVENPEVKSALEASLQELRETLSQKGISVKEISVGISRDGHRGGQEYAGDRRKKDRDDEETGEFRSLLEEE